VKEKRDEGNYTLDIEKGKLKRQQHPYLLSNETDGGGGVLACSFIHNITYITVIISCITT
jgi:hypothetical protein